MKEIDFLPKWYKSGRRRQISMQRQYIALVCIFAAMMMWNFIAGRSISKAMAELAESKPKQAEAASESHKLARIKSQVNKLQKKTKSIKAIDSKIDVASVLAEIGFLTDEKIALGKLTFSSESVVSRPTALKNVNPQLKKQSPIGDVRFKVVMSGVAADASNVAELICKLEDSPYFCRVIPSFSRNREIKTAAHPAGTGKNYQVSEFEISCYLANYNESISPRADIRYR